MTRPPALAGWHAVVDARDPGLLDNLLADGIVFRSPAVFAPQEGRALATAYLTAAIHVLGPSLHYKHEWVDEGGAILEFEADLDGTYVHGIDMLRWNDDGRLTDFTVMVRPLKGLQALIGEMGRRLA